jgi:hypothetical protein
MAPIVGDLFRDSSKHPRGHLAEKGLISFRRTDLCHTLGGNGAQVAIRRMAHKPDEPSLTDFLGIVAPSEDGFAPEMDEARR